MKNKPAIFLGADAHDIHWGDNDDPNGILEVGKKYKIEDVIFYTVYTAIKLCGFEGYFNSKSFKIGEFEHRKSNLADIPPAIKRNQNG